MTTDPCHWHLCRLPSDDALRDVALTVDGRTWTLDRVPLCWIHLAKMRRTGRIDLRYHPSEGAPATRKARQPMSRG